MLFHCNRCVMLITAFLLVIMLALPGCSHQVLTFFFTGVPEPGQEEAAAESTAVTPSRRERVRRSYAFTHGPFAANSCNLCHQSRSGSVFSRQEDSAVATDSRDVSPRLAQPLAELCVGCHSGHRPAAAKASGLWQHGPVANLQCTDCHSPHKSSRRLMLLDNNNVGMCGQCHSSSDLRHTPQHADDPAADCTDCHNPHTGKNPLMLKREYDERSRFDRI